MSGECFLLHSCQERDFLPVNTGSGRRYPVELDKLPVMQAQLRQRDTVGRRPCVVPGNRKGEPWVPPFRVTKGRVTTSVGRSSQSHS
ncbi:hypothetical protein AAMO2058_001093000 [Amorphochlora amoebiformis]